jgi:hypothetical protein
MTDLENLTAEIRFATNYQINKRVLKEKILTDLHVAYAGGLFKVTIELLAFLSTWPNDILYLEDTYQNPIEINRTEFLTLCQSHYQQVMNTWHIQHAELKQIRKL